MGAVLARQPGLPPPPEPASLFTYHVVVHTARAARAAAIASVDPPRVTLRVRHAPPPTAPPPPPPPGDHRRNGSSSYGAHDVGGGARETEPIELGLHNLTASYDGLPPGSDNGRGGRAAAAAKGKGGGAASNKGGGGGRAMFAAGGVDVFSVELREELGEMLQVVVPSHPAPTDHTPLHPTTDPPSHPPILPFLPSSTRRPCPSAAHD